MIAQQMKSRSILYFMMILITLFIGSNPLADAVAGTSRAFIVGVADYESPTTPDLPLVNNDLSRLYSTLTKYGQFEKKYVLRVSDNSPLKPTSTVIKSQFSQWLSKAISDDSILVYFSGHGFRDAEGNLYLATSDFDIKRPSETGLPISWVRDQIANCKAGFKLLILDSCHAGSEKNVEKDIRVSAKDLGATFEDLNNVVTIASSQADEKSLFYFDQKRSLFSFWLTEGLKGHADLNQDGNIDIDELYKYVSRRVRHSAKILFNKPQTPVRIVRTGVIDVPVVLRLQPQPLKRTLNNMAEHIAIVMQENKLKQLGVLEFMDNTNTLQEKLGGKFGLLGKYCSEEMDRQLSELKLEGGFGLVNRKRLRNALKEQGFKIDDLSSNAKLSGLSKSVGNMPVVVLGSFQSRKGRVVRLRCNLEQTSGFEELGAIGGTAELSLDEWAMLGRSASIRAEDRQVNPFNQQTENISIETQVINKLDARSEGGHILQDPTFPFDVQLVIDGKVRKGVIRGNDYFVPVSQGEVYRIRIVNKRGRKGTTAVMKLLVDGLDTLPKANADKDKQSSQEKALVTEYWGLPVTHLSDARSWILDPKEMPSDFKDVAWEVPGFVTQTGEQGKLREFKIVDAANSLAGRQGFTDQVGLITVAFYTAKPSARSLGTAAGQIREENLKERAGIAAGNLMGVVHLRYVDAKSLVN